MRRSSTGWSMAVGVAKQDPVCARYGGPILAGQERDADHHDEPWLPRGRRIAVQPVNVEAVEGIALVVI